MLEILSKPTPDFSLWFLSVTLFVFWESLEIKSDIYLLIKFISLMLSRTFFSFCDVRPSSFFISFSNSYWFSDDEDYGFAPLFYVFYWAFSKLFYKLLYTVDTLSDNLLNLFNISFWFWLRSLRQSIMILKFLTTISSLRLHYTLTVTVFYSWIYPNFCISHQ